MYSKEEINKLVSAVKEYDYEYIILTTFCLKVLQEMKHYMELDTVDNLYVFMNTVSFYASSTRDAGGESISFPVEDLLKTPKEVANQIVQNKKIVLEQQAAQAKLEHEKREKIKLRELLKKYPDEVNV